MAVVCTASGKLSQCRAPSSWDEGGWVGTGLYPWAHPCPVPEDEGSCGWLPSSMGHLLLFCPSSVFELKGI